MCRGPCAHMPNSDGRLHKTNPSFLVLVPLPPPSPRERVWGGVVLCLLLVSWLHCLLSLEAFHNISHFLERTHRGRETNKSTLRKTSHFSVTCRRLMENENGFRLPQGIGNMETKTRLINSSHNQFLFAFLPPHLHFVDLKSDCDEATCWL